MWRLILKFSNALRIIIFCNLIGQFKNGMIVIVLLLGRRELAGSNLHFDVFLCKLKKLVKFTAELL